MALKIEGYYRLYLGGPGRRGASGWHRGIVYNQTRHGARFLDIGTLRTQPLSLAALATAELLSRGSPGLAAHISATIRARKHSFTRFHTAQKIVKLLREQGG